jgi:1,4-dihydroxy-2-naphthoate octaprenyltransferase
LKLETLSRMVKLGRLRFPLNGLLLFSFGALLAAHSGAKFVAERFIVGASILFTANLSVSYSNDYYDVEVDRHGEPTTFAGGSGVLVRHPELRALSKWFAILLILLSISLAFAFTLVFSFPPSFLAFVAVGNLLGWYYTAPPLRLSYRGLSEAVTTIVLGLIVPGTGYYVLKGFLDWTFAVFSPPLILYGLVFIIGVEIPDMESDRLGDKNTVIARRGRGFGFKTVGVLLSLATTYFLAARAVNLAPPPIDLGVFAALSLLPLAVGVEGLMRRPEEWEAATRLVTRIIYSLSLFLTIGVSYLIFTLNRLS